MTGIVAQDGFLEAILLQGKNDPQALISALLAGNQTHADVEVPDSPVPEGYAYTQQQQAVGGRAVPENTPGLKTVAFHAHPSDVSGDFGPYIIMFEKEATQAPFRQVLLTKGEATSARVKEPYLGQDIIAIREVEEKQASDLVGLDGTDYLTDAEGKTFPDGQCMTRLPDIKERMKAYIREHKPERIILPSPYPDHADHLATYIAGMNAILDLQKEG